MTTPVQEEKLGDQAWQQIQQKEKLTSNKNMSDAVKRVGQRIAKVANAYADNFKWEFKTFESDQANAFCLPGGKVAVYTGLFQYADCDAELAHVMGHEIGHAIARHGGERISEEQVRQVGGNIVSALSGKKYSKLASVVYGGATQLGVMLPYSRTHEYEADEIGLQLMAKAGYDPQYALLFWQKFAEAGKIANWQEFLSTHPISSKRLTSMKKQLPMAIEYYNKASEKLKSGQVYTWKKKLKSK
jgi:predicted Zn-dependent protease